MFGKKRVDTLVVGAGPCGMLAALALADAGEDVMIVDSAARTCTSSNAAILHRETLALLRQLGIAQRVVTAGYPIHQVSLYDGRRHRKAVHPDPRPDGLPFALSIPQSRLEAILEDELSQAGTRVLWNHRVSEYEPDENALHVVADRYSDRGTGYAISHMERVIVKSIHIRCDTLIAADGYNSILHRFAGVETETLGRDQHFATFEFETDSEPKHTCLLSIEHGLATAQQPVTAGVARLQFQLEGLTLPSRNREKERAYLQEEADIPEELDEAHFMQLVKERVPWNIEYTGKLRYRAAVPFKKRFLTAPRSSNVFFLGDSARTFSPLASLSLNLGLQEAKKLADLLSRSASDEPRLRHQQLDELGEEMVKNWKMLANLSGSSVPSAYSDPWIAANRGRILRSLPATSATLEEIAQQLHLTVESHRQPTRPCYIESDLVT